LFGKRVEIVVKQYSTRVLELNLQILPRQNFTRRDGESLNRTILNLLFSLHYWRSDKVATLCSLIRQQNFDSL